MYHLKNKTGHSIAIPVCLNNKLPELLILKNEGINY